MTGRRLRALRMDLGLTQAEAARRWGLSQPYVSLVEQGRRPVPDRLVAALAPPVVLAGERHQRTSTDLGVALGNLGYPGFRYLANGRRVDPVVVVLEALRADDVSPRVLRALPWVLAHHADLDWPRLLPQVKALTLQNALGFLASLARRLAMRDGRAAVVERLREVERELEEVRLVRERSLGRRLAEAEARHVRAHRSALARHWRVLSELTVDDVATAAA
ncbi:helix-turn-helix transcriptional regulator [Luteitalea sp.]|uniref:helix-turn-helix domain-containing protein n=1 Tax=Luteitalea sp. TaxID=2004800 RepID=UPI0025C2944D|nr:helix-turn-helix transcriptional regulator [Luteitalea sp.]